MATLNVGVGQAYQTLAAAIAASHDGDVIQVAPGIYTNDFATINTKITIEGVGGMVHLLATIQPPDGKAILTINTDVTLINMEFSGATVPDGNGAGIRYQGGNLVLDHNYFHDNENGLLSAPDAAGSITISNSEFSHNGSGTGSTHNIYVGEIGTLTITDSYFHDAVVGHEIKSRAHTNIIENNRIGNGPSGTGSYAIDLPNGGNATIQNNVIEKGPNAQNPHFIAFGEEGPYAGSALSVTGNTVLNDGSGNRFLVLAAGGTTVSITNNQIYALDSNHLSTGSGSSSASGNTFLVTEPAFDTSPPYLPVATVCFAEGTRILTSCGEVPVEQLKAGDLVITISAGNRVARPVKWIGHRPVTLTGHTRPETVMPVRFARGALADNVPQRDLLLSPDHAVCLDGVLIVARQLINGGSVVQDDILGSVRYFHVELESHSIILAEGAATESYLDTGNRGFFINANAPVTLHPRLTGDGSELRVSLSCLPFRDDEPTVRPIWQRLADRAVRMGYAGAMRATTGEPEFRVAAGNRLIRAISVARGRHLFVLPAGVIEIRLHSRAATPVECRPWLEDRRKLGVSVSGIVLHGHQEVVEIFMDDPKLRDGWWAVERDGDVAKRWTDGKALVPVPRQDRPSVLEIHLAGEMIYPCHDEAGDSRTAFARRA